MADQPWFVRRRRAAKVSINPVGRGGWLLTLGYVLLAVATTPLLLLLGMPVGVFSFEAVMAALTVAFVVIAWRTSVPEGDWRGGK